MIVINCTTAESVLELDPFKSSRPIKKITLPAKITMTQAIKKCIGLQASYCTSNFLLVYSPACKGRFIVDHAMGTLTLDPKKHS